MHDGMPYGRNQGQGHSKEVDRQSPTVHGPEIVTNFVICVFCLLVVLVRLSVPV